MRIVTIGDAFLDVIVEPQRQAVIDDDVPARIALVAGGQAANVAAWCAHLGAQAAILTATGDDPAGRLIRDWLSERGVSLLGPHRSGSSGAVVSLTGPAGTRTMLSDRGRLPVLGPADVDGRWFAGAAWLHISGYALFAEDGYEALVAAAAAGHSGGATVGVDLSSAALVETIGVEEARRRITAVGAAVVYGNETEWRALGHLDVAVRVTKRGERGCTVVSADSSVDVGASEGGEVRDTTGAGDAFAAGWMVGGVCAALAAARECIGQAGGAPP